MSDVRTPQCEEWWFLAIWKRSMKAHRNWSKFGTLPYETNCYFFHHSTEFSQQYESKFCTKSLSYFHTFLSPGIFLLYQSHPFWYHTLESSSFLFIGIGVTDIVSFLWQRTMKSINQSTMRFRIRRIQFWCTFDPKGKAPEARERVKMVKKYNMRIKY